jgi:Tfp pilus assembly protein PilW
MSASEAQRRRPNRKAGLTLVEVMVATGLLGTLMAAVLSSFVFMLRGEQSLANYTTMNSEARELLELMSRDAKSAVAVTNFTANSLTLTVPLNKAGGTTDVTYEFDAGTNSFIREANGGTQTLVRDVSAFSFRYLNSQNSVTTSLVELKQVQLSLRIVRTVSLATTSQYVISAQYTLRAKPTAH